MDSAKPSRKSNPRLQKFLAECGFGSRRACEELIRSGAVCVDGQPVTELGVRVEPSSQRIQVHGREARPQSRFTLVINKPPRIICTCSDPEGRKTVQDLLPSPPARLYTVGRLDYLSEGLLLLTNEGELAHRLTHPRFHIEKEYRVQTSRALTGEDRKKLCQGVEESGEILRALTVRRGRKPLESNWVLGEGKNRQIRRMASALGTDVTRLERVRLGSLELGPLAPGAWRELSSEERATLEQAVGLRP